MKFFEKGELKLLWPFYLEYLLSSLLFFAPAFMVLFLTKLNFSFTQIGILFAINPLIALIFEVPTGAIADLYGRKFSVLLGYTLEGLCMLSLFFAKSYYSVLIIFSIWGMAATFSSGSKDAWVVDQIKKENKKLVHNFFTKMQIFISFGLVFSGIIGAIFVNYFGVSIIWMIASFSYLISIILIGSLTHEDYKRRKSKINESFNKIITQSKKTISYGYKHHVLFYYLSAALLLAFIGNLTASIPWTAFLKELSFPDSYFGYMWSAMGIFSMLGPIVASKILNKGKERNFIILTFIASAIAISFILIPKEWSLALVILLFFSFLYNMGRPASEVFFHRFIPSKMRATMGSVRSMMIYIGGIFGGFFSGYLIDLIGVRYTMVLFVPLIIPVIILYLKIKEEKTENPKETSKQKL